jgi:hypothetical protein
MERLIFDEFVKSAGNPCQKRFDKNPETSSRHISGMVTGIATILQSCIPRASQSTSLSIYILKASTVYFGQIFVWLIATFLNANNSKTVNAINPFKLRLLRRSPHAWLLAYQA